MREIKQMKTPPFGPASRKTRSTCSAPGSFCFKQRRAEVSRTNDLDAAGIFATGLQKKIGQSAPLGRASERPNGVLGHRKDIDDAAILPPLQFLTWTQAEAFANSGGNRRLPSIRQRCFHGIMD